MARSFLILSVISFTLLHSLSGCGPKKGSALAPRETTSKSASNTKSGPIESEPEKLKKIYYADLQVLIETSTEGICADSLRLNEALSQEFMVSLSEGKVSSRYPLDYYALNVQMKAMGFDNFESNFTALDGVVPEAAPYQFRVRRRPGNFIDLFYLGETFRMQLTQTPVYSFKMKEERSAACTVNHVLNIFADRVGYYEKN